MKETFQQMLGRQLEVRCMGDNTATIQLVKGEATLGRSKHVAARVMWLNELLSRGAYSLRHVPGNQLVADVLTKGCNGPRATKAREMLGMESLQQREGIKKSRACKSTSEEECERAIAQQPHQHGPQPQQVKEAHSRSRRQRRRSASGLSDARLAKRAAELYTRERVQKQKAEERLKLVEEESEEGRMQD